MAKQDLVVKLLLDSGAFGNDLRAAERKAQEFSNNMRNAGQTAGNLGKELNLATGALGKLGGALTGAGAVVAAVGAFKSVMESTSGTATQFQSTIAGFQGVLDTFQTSIATFDFSNFNDGLLTVFRNAKNVRQAINDMNFGGIAYNYLSGGYKADLKKYKSEYTSTETTVERKEEITSLVDETIKEWDTSLKNQKSNVINAFRAKMKDKDNDLDMDAVSETLAEEWMREAAAVMLDPEAKKEWMKRVKGINKDINKYNRQSEWNDFRSNLANGFNNGDAKADFDKAVQAAEDEKDKLIKKHQKDLFINEIFEMNEKELTAAIQQLDEINRLTEEYYSTQDEIRGSIKPTTTITTTTKTTGGGGDGKNKIENAKDSIGWLKEQIATQEQLRNSVVQGSADWVSYTKNLYGHKEALEAAMKEQEKYDAQFITTTKPYADDSIASVQNQISEQQKLINTLEYGSIEWRAAIALLVQYNGELDEMMENLKNVQEEMGNPNKIKPEEGSLSKLKEEIAEVQALVDKAEATRDSYTYGSDKWKAASEAVDEYMAKLGVLMDMMKQMQEDPNAKKYEELNKVNLALTTTVSLVDALGVALSDSEKQSVRNLQGITNAMSSIANGAIALIEIYKASGVAAGTASAAAMPFPYNLAAIATVVSTIMSVFGNISKMSKNKFADGGIVGGTSYSGDKLFAMVNSGEMILNKRQQGNLANMIGGGGQVEFHISGDSLVGVLNNKRNKTNLTR